MKNKKHFLGIFLLGTFILSLTISSSIIGENNKKSITNTPKSAAIGDVWLVDNGPHDTGDTFETIIYANSGIQRLASYGIIITFDPTILQIVDVKASTGGFMAARNIDNIAGSVFVAGFETAGKDPSAMLDLFVINWTAEAVGISPIGIAVDSITDTSTAIIGIPNGIANSVTVTDIPNLQTPILIATADDVTYDETDTSAKFFSWTASDDNPTTYDITRDGLQVATGVWTSNVAVSIPVGSQAVGTYTYVIIFTDADGLSVSDTALAIVEENFLGAGDVWLVDNGPHETGDSFETIVYANSGNQRMASYGIIVTFDPTILQIVDVKASTGGFMAARNIDNIAGSVFVAGFETAGKDPSDMLDLFVINWVAEGVGISSIGITVDSITDTSTAIIGIPNGIANSFTVTDIPIPQTPILIATVDDVTYDETDTSAKLLSWTASDDNPTTYAITRDGLQVATGVWTSNVAVSIPVGNQAVGTYTYVITFTDADGLFISDVAVVTVTYVPKNPVFTSLPVDISYDETDATSYSLSWTATDDNPAIYIITKNGIQIATGGWTSNAAISIPVGNQAIGTYTYIITLTDSDGSLVTDTAMVTVNRVPVAPALTSAAVDIAYEETDTTGYSLSWTATDDIPATYTITKDDIQVATGVWTSNIAVSIPVGGQAVGIYSYIITFTDADGLSVSDTAILTVNRVPVAPVLTAAAVDVIYNDGTIVEHLLSWTATDDNPTTYTITKDGIKVATGGWTSNIAISIPVGSQSVGIYSYTLTLNDGDGLSMTDTASVEVLYVAGVPIFDTIASDITYDEGDSGDYSLNWTATDDNPTTYNITVNGVLVDSGSWISGEPISISVDNQNAGVYTYVIIFIDEDGLAITETTVVTVKDVTATDTNTDTSSTTSDDPTGDTGSGGISWDLYSGIGASIIAISFIFLRYIRRRNR